MPVKERRDRLTAELQLTRRAFLRDGSLLVLATAGSSHPALAKEEEPRLKIGLLTDTHYADAETRGTRFYRESLGKMREAVKALNREKVDLAVELGDLIDTPSPPDVAIETSFLKTITSEFKKIGKEQHYILGNHCVSALTKEQFLAGCGQNKSYYSFDRNGVHIVLLDACFRADGAPYAPGNFKWTDTAIPRSERDWLEADLQATPHKTVVFVHQRLDLPVGHDYAIATSPEVRAVLEKSGKVIAVFQGHSHKNEYQEINGIPYCVLAAMVEGSGEESSGYSSLSVFADGSLKLTGFRRHADHPFTKRTPKS